MGEKLTVAVLGASPNPTRYSNKAIRRLLEKGHEVIPVNPEYGTIEGLTSMPSLHAIACPVDTVTVYLNPLRVIPYIPEIVAMRPRRVIMNPGAEAECLELALDNAGILHLKACTLVLLSTNQF